MEFFLWLAPVAFRRVALETPEWTSKDSNHHRQSVSAGKTDAIPTEPSGRLGPIRWSALSSVQARSRRLMSISKAAFHDNPRCVALVNAFSEGVALHAVGSGDRMSVAVNQQSNGYELLRQLTLEFSIRSRSEALSLRTQIAGRSFVLAAAQTSPSSLVSDAIRKIDHEAARFSRLLGTLPMHVDTTGLKLADSDVLVVLLRSLPEAVKNYVLHHSSADTY